MCRDQEGVHKVLVNDYFVNDSKYDVEMFRGRFRLPKDLFLKIVGDIKANFEWFQVGYDARNKRSFTPLQKCTSRIRQLATGNVPEKYDEYLAMSERNSRECLEYFGNEIIRLYGRELLRKPTSHDMARLYVAHEARWGLPGMLGSIDCTHIVWRMCPTSLRGQFMRGDHKKLTIMLEEVASNDLSIWHAFFGAAGSKNDLNVLHQSPIFNNEMHGTAPRCPFVVNGREYRRDYYLVDGIYPSLSVFVKSFAFPVLDEEKKFKKLQESARKDVERAFGVLKGRWGILNRPARAIRQEKIRDVVYACHILHNMLIKEDGNAISPNYVMDPLTEEAVPDDIILELRNEETHFGL